MLIAGSYKVSVMTDESEALEQSEYRVGKWDGSVEDGEFELTHDHIDLTIRADVLELQDLDNLLAILLSKEKIVRGDVANEEEVIEDFNLLVSDLEA